MSGERGSEREVVIFPTCLVDTVASDVGRAVVRVLEAAGCEVSVPAAATCCGQPAWNAGFVEDSARVAKTTLDALEQSVGAGAASEGGGDEAVVCVPAGSCAAMIRTFWPELFELVGDTDARDRAQALGRRVYEFSELLDEIGAGALGGVFEGRIAYHHSCHMLRELRIKQQPLDLIAKQDNAEVVEWAGDERCCGFGGLFSVKQPELSVAMADDKLAGIAESGADVLVGCDTSCLMHLEGRAERVGLDIRVLHLAELLDQALAGGEDA